MADRRPLVVGGTLLAAAVWLCTLPVEQPAPASAEPLEPPPASGVETPPAAGEVRRAGTVEPWIVRLALDPLAEQRAGDPEAGNALSAPTVLTGRVVWRQEPWRPVVDLSLELTGSWLDTVLPTEDGAETLTPRERIRAVTDERGRFVLTPVPTEHELFLLMGKGTDRHDFQKVRDLPRPGQRLDLGDLLLDLRGAVAGRVVDTRGEPVPGVEVRAVDDPMLDGDVHADELRRARRTGLERFRLDGMAGDEPVPDAVVRRDALLPFPRTSTDEEGRFVLRGLRPGLHDLFLKGAYHLGASRSILVAARQTTELGELTLADARQITGKIVLGDAKGEPVVGGRIAAVAVDFATGPRPAGTDANGEFELDGLDPELPYRLLFRYPDGGPWVHLAGLRGRALPKEPLLLVVPRMDDLRFRLIDPAGRAVEGGDMLLLTRGGALRPRDTRLPKAFQPEETEPGGFVAELPGAFRGAETLAIAWAPGHGTAVATLSPERWDQAFRHGLPIVLLPAYPVTVQVADDEGAPVPRARVLVDIAAREDMDFAGSDWNALLDGQVGLGRTDPAGLFLAERMWPAAMTFAASHPDFVPSPTRTIVPRPGDVVRLVLQRPGRIVGQLTEDRRHVQRRFRIAARPHWPEHHALDDNPFLKPQRVWSNDDGSFVVPQLHPGVWLLQPLDPPAPSMAGLPEDQEKYLAHEVLLEPGQHLHTDLEMVARRLETPALAGRVLVDGAPGGGLVVRLGPSFDERMQRRIAHLPESLQRRLLSEVRGFEPAAWKHAVTTDPWGGFSFFRLEPGFYRLRIERPWQGRMQILGTVITRVEEPGRARRLDEEPPPEPLEIELRTGSILASLFEPGGAPLPGRMLRLRDDGEDGADLLLLTDERGNVRCDLVPAGSYTVALEGGGRRQTIERIEVAAGEVTALTLFAAARRTAGAGGR